MRIINTIWLGGSGDSESILADGPEPRPSLNHALSANDNLQQFEFCHAHGPADPSTQSANKGLVPFHSLGNGQGCLIRATNHTLWSETPTPRSKRSKSVPGYFKGKNYKGNKSTPLTALPL